MHYFVTWDIDIEADSPEEAAAKALKIQRDPASWATVFDVNWVDSDDKPCAQRVDLLEQP